MGRLSHRLSKLEESITPETTKCPHCRGTGRPLGPDGPPAARDLEEWIAADRVIEKLAQRKLKCHRPAFRWGASAAVTSPTHFSVVACESEVFKKRSTRVDIDVFP